jgi:hypothetical protein
LGLLFLVVGAFAADTDLAGGYVGGWQSGSSGNGGAIRFVLERSGGAWKGSVAFTLEGAEVPCTMRTVKLQDGKVELVYDFDLQGFSLRSTVKGEWKDKEFRGSYETTMSDGSVVDAGTWSAKRKL